MTPALRRIILGGKWTPRRLGSAIAAWYDASDPSTLFQDSALTTAAVADADPVGGWKDKSGLGNHAIQATTTKRFSLKLAIKNGRPVVRGDGVDDFLQKLTISIATPVTVVLVCRELAGAFSKYLFDGGASNQSPVTIPDATHISMGGTPVITSAACTPTNWQLLTCQFNSASSAIAINGGADTTGNALTNALTGITLGGSGSGAAVVNGDYAEVIVCGGRLLAASELARLKSYLNAKWAIY
jgi:hypothetical protein